MKATLTTFFFLCLSLHIAGCAGVLTGRHKEMSLLEHCRAEAFQWEEKGELQQALLYWEIIRELSPPDEQAAEKIAHLKETIENKADVHFRQAVAFYKKGSSKKARQEFLVALRYNPNHKKALDYLKNRLTWEGHTTYKVKADDTLRDIARKVYKDLEKDFVVAYFMGIDIKAKPVPGTVVRLPKLAPEFSGPIPKIVEEPGPAEKLAEARKLFNDKEYEKVLAITGKILEYDAGNKQAVDLQNASYFQMGKKLRAKRKYLDSLKMLKNVDPEYEGVTETISAVNRSRLKQADIHYRKGVKNFVDEDLEKAIEEWEKTLALNPEHEKAKKDIENAKSLLEKWKKIR